MSINKRRYILSCFLSILHLEKSSARKNLFNRRLENYPLPAKALIKILNQLSMTTLIAILVCTKLIFKIIIRRTKLYCSENIFAFSCTINQEKALQKLENNIDISLKDYNDNYLLLFRSFIKAIIISFTKRKVLKKIREKNLSFMIEVIKFTFYFNYLDKYIKDFPEHAVVANDHSPEPLAFVTIAKLRGAKITYLQHGHISTLFPPLFRFDLSVLYGEKSKEVYKSIGKASHDIALSGYKYSLAKRLVPCPKNFHVTIFPNIIDESRLEKVLDQLKMNSEVKHIYIKPHPLHQISKKFKNRITSKNYIEILPHDFDFRPITHLGIAGNSSIHIELLSEGITTLYSDELDNIDFDYYNFIGSKAVMYYKDLSTVSSKSINEFYQDTKWRENVSQFDSSFLSKDKLNKELKKIKDFFS